MRVELVNTGTELLLGNTLNTHLPFVARALFPLGLRIARQVTVPDGTAIREALSEALDRSDIILVTGGLGPTTDDVTRDWVAELLGLPLVRDEAVARAIEERFSRRGLSVPDRAWRQAEVPAGARPIENPNGTAPGLGVATRWTGGDRPGPRHLFLLPGPPRELRPMMADQVVPALAALCPCGTSAPMRVWIIAGSGESVVEERVGADLVAIEGLELGYCARPGEVEIRGIGPAKRLDEADRIIAEKLGSQLVSRTGESLDRVVSGLLRARGETLSVAESCTGGAICSSLTDLAGASDLFVEGFITYSNRAKEARLGVPAELLRQRGAVSDEVARAMAEGALETAGTDWALAVTGIAGPGGGTGEKPVGTVFIGLAGKRCRTVTERHRFFGERETFKRLTGQAALDLLRRNF
jgi:nicotinamide-nucleotide amidase